METDEGEEIVKEVKKTDDGKINIIITNNSHNKKTGMDRLSSMMGIGDLAGYFFGGVFCLATMGNLVTGNIGGTFVSGVMAMLCFPPLYVWASDKTGIRLSPWARLFIAMLVMVLGSSFMK